MTAGSRLAKASTAASSDFRSASKPARSRLAGLALIVAAAALATAPQLIRGNSCGHDFNVHLVSWLDCANAWRHGIFYPHWTPSANWGAGEPRFVFYPPLTWMAGAALGLVFGWSLAPIVLTFLCLAGTGLATRALALETCQDAVATLAGCTAIFSGFTLFTAYERAAFPEFTGGIWLPLLLLFALRHRDEPSTLRAAFDGSTVPLALVLAACWLSNAPLGVIASYLLAGVALLDALLRRSWAPLLRAGAAGALGLAATAFYWIPAEFEQRWVDIRQATEDPGYNFENNWAFAHHPGPLLAAHDQVLRQVSWIAVSMIAVAWLALAVCWRRGTLPAKTNDRGKLSWIPLAAIPAVTLVLLFPVSRPVWHWLPEFRFLQYPWRWLEAVEAPMAMFFAAAVWPARRRARRAIAIALAAGFAGAAYYAGTAFFQVCDSEDSVPSVLLAFRNGTGFEGMYEYAPPGSDRSLIAAGLPDACLTADAAAALGHPEPDRDQLIWNAQEHSCLQTYRWSSGRGADAEHLRMRANLPQPGTLVLRLLSYPAWAIQVNGRPPAALPRRQDGLIAIPVTRGPVDLRIDWTTTPDAAAGRWIAALGLLALCAMGWFEPRPSRAQVS
ncbi:MAG: 6-pyruvoyl-tetrahydropterin synthase-related protein [Acidobacteriota bacterium]